MPIRERLKAAIDHLRRDYLQTAWKWGQRLRVVRFYLRNASGWIKRLSILAASLTMARLVVQSVELSRLEPNVLAAYFIAVGAMIGGILAIVFSISIFAQQSATDLSSSGYFEDYTGGWNEKLIYVLIVTTTLFFFTLGLLFNGRQITDAWKEWAIHASLVLIGVVFVLIDWHYQNVSMKLSPLKAMSYLEGRAVKFLKSVHADAKKIARLLQANKKDASDGLALAAAYNRYLQPHLTHLDRQIENLFEIALRLSARQEVMTTNRALGSVANILYQYLDARKTSSVAWPSSVSILAFESDSQSFLTKSFERLNNAGQRFIKEGKTENATYAVNVYRALAAKAGDITFQQKHYENPIVDQIIGYLGFYIKFAIQEKNLDVVLSGTRGLGVVAQVALKQNLQSSLFGVHSSLYEIAVFGVTAKATFITDECIGVWQSILSGLFQHKVFEAEAQISEALQKMGAVTKLLHTAITTGYLPGDFSTRISLGKPYDEMYLLISIILKVYFEQLKEEKDREHYRENLVKLLKEIYSNIRHLSEQVPIIESSLATSIGSLLGNLNAMMIRLLDDKSFADEGEELREQLYANIHLPSFLFIHPDSFKAGRFESLTESVAKTGILLLQRQDADDLVLTCVNSLYSIVKKQSEKGKEGYGFDEPRIMLKVCYLGVLALKQGRRHILTEVGLRIYEFEELFQRRYLTNLPAGVDPDAGNIIGLPRRDQLFREVLRWRDEFRREKYNRIRIMGHAQEMMYGCITEIDIDRFMFDVWGSVPAHSPVVKEIQERFAKRNEMAKLVRLLKAWIEKRHTAQAAAIPLTEVSSAQDET